MKPVLVVLTLFASSVLISAQAMAATSGWLPSISMDTYLMWANANGMRPTKIACKNIGREFYLQVVTEPNPERYQWQFAWNGQMQWKVTKSRMDKRNFRLISHMAYPDSEIGGRFCAVWIGPVW